MLVVDFLDENILVLRHRQR